MVMLYNTKVFVTFDNNKMKLPGAPCTIDRFIVQHMNIEMKKCRDQHESVMYILSCAIQ